MSPHPQPIDLDAPPPGTVVEFGGPPPGRRRPRWSPVGFGRALAGDRRLVPVAAAIAALAAFASLVSEWQLTTMDRTAFGSDQAGGDRVVPTEFSDLGVLGAGYLVGLFLLAAAVVLTLFGPTAGRHYARLTGLSTAGVLFALLVALASSLGEQSRTVARIYTLELNDDQLQLTRGRGVWCAFAAVLLALLALVVAGRHLRPSGAPTGTEAPAADAGPGVDPAAGWSWRRPRDAAGDQEWEPDEPLDLTVGPAKPFTPYAADRGRPNRPGRPGISG